MLYEPWVETASSYNDLRDRLKTRGYTNLPMGENPMLRLGGYSKAPMANTSDCEVVRTMIRKKKDQ